MVAGEGSSPAWARRGAVCGVVDVTAALNVWPVGFKEGPEGEFPP